MIDHATATRLRRFYGDKIRKGFEAPGDFMVYEFATEVFYEPQRKINENRPPVNGWWHLPLAEWAWHGDARTLGA